MVISYYCLDIQSISWVGQRKRRRKCEWCMTKVRNWSIITGGGLVQRGEGHDFSCKLKRGVTKICASL
jgi:hypothetical protein